ncbi:MAG: prepilin-type N-terminal cleavage/methylation domain-containing protein [Syntrophaceae bacterium]|nr:prepilin-type N-terminal cleavage/methylation domain-containing protein [Syntrophaceae bacterium]
MKRTVKKLNGQNGFTMLEIICTLIIIGIVSAVVFARMTSTRDYDLDSQVEVVKNHLRLAQSRALSSGSPWGINFNSTTTYYLFKGTGSTTPEPIINEKSSTVDLTAKKSALTITPPAATGGRVTFDSFGSPGAANITVGTNAGDIIVTKNTGFIP